MHSKLEEASNRLKEEQDRGRKSAEELCKLQQRFDNLSLEYLSLK